MSKGNVFDWVLFKTGPYFAGRAIMKLAVHCPTKILEIDFRIEGHLNGFNFNFGEILSDSQFYTYGEDTCYVGEDGRCDSYENLKSQGYDIYEWSDFCENRLIPTDKPKKEKFDWSAFFAEDSKIAVKCSSYIHEVDFYRECVSHGVKMKSSNNMGYYNLKKDKPRYCIKNSFCLLEDATEPIQDYTIIDWSDYMLPQNLLMTKRVFNWYKFCNKKYPFNIFVHCCTEELAINFCEEMHSHRLKWDNGVLYCYYMWSGEFDDEICYTNKGTKHFMDADNRKDKNAIEWSDYYDPDSDDVDYESDSNDVDYEINLFTTEYIPTIKDRLRYRDMLVRIVSEASLDLSLYKGKPYAVHLNSEELALKFYWVILNSGLSTDTLRAHHKLKTLYSQYKENSCITLDGKLRSLEEAKKQGYEILNLVEE